MATRQRKKGAEGADKEDGAATSTPQAEADQDGLAAFLPGGKHAMSIQVGLLVFVAIGSCINLYFNPPDRTHFRESYRAPLRWYDQFADEYAALATSWGYTLPAKVAERLQAVHTEASVDMKEARILEIGAGSGLLGIELHRLGYRHISGLDISPKLASAHLGEMSTKAYEMFITADAETIPLEAADSSLDAVLCVGTAGYLARGLRGGEQDLERSFDGKDLQPEGVRVRRLLEEWLRVLKPGGILGLTIEKQLAEMWEAEQKQLSLRLSQLEVHDALSAFPLHRDKEIREALTGLYFFKKLA